jgi:hypothetical protein
MSHVFVEHVVGCHGGRLEFVKHMVYFLIQECESCEIKIETGLNLE